jgi:hypothetical protein
MNDLDVTAAAAPRSDQLNADDLIAGPVTVTITGVRPAKVAPQEGKPAADVIYVEITGYKPWKPCKTMIRVLGTEWGFNAAKWVGRSLTLYRDPAVRFGGDAVGGIRVSHMSHIAKARVHTITTSKTSRAPYRVEPLVVTKAPPVREFDAWAAAVRQHLHLDPDAIAEWYAAAGKGDLTTMGRAVLEPLYAGLNGGPELAAFRASPFGAP